MSENQIENILGDVSNEQSKVSEAVENEAVSTEEVAAAQEETVSENIKPAKTKWWQKVLPEKERAFAFSFLGALSALFLPYLLKTVAVLIVKRPLSSFADVAFNVLGVALAVLFLAFMEKECAIFERKSFVRSIMYIASAFLFSKVFFKYLISVLYVRLLNRTVLCWVIVALAVLFVAILIALAMPGKGKFIRNTLVGLAFILLYELFAELFDLVRGLFGNSFLSNSFFLIATALMVASLIKFYIGKKVKTPVKENSKKSFILPGVLFSFILGINVYYSLPSSPQDIIITDLYSSIQQATVELMEGNIDLALDTLSTTLVKRDYWEVFCKDRTSDMSGHDIDTSDFIQINLLVWEKDNDVESMEECLTNEGYSLDVAKEYLKECNKNNIEPNRELESMIVEDMVCNNSFTANTLSYENIEDCKDEILNELDKLKAFDSYEEILDLAKQIGLSGLQEPQMDSLLDIAENNPTDIYMQYLVAEYGTSYYVNPWYYDRIGETIFRFKDAYEEEYGYSASVDTDIEGKLFRIRQYDKLIELVLSKDSPSKIDRGYLAQAYLRNGEFDSCLSVAKDILKEDAQDYNALYCVAYCSLINLDMDTSIEYACKLAEELKVLEDRDKELADAELYMLVERYIVGDLDFKRIDENISDNQKELIRSSDVFTNYLYSVWYCYSEQDSELAKKYTSLLEAEIGDTSTTYFLKGCIYMNNEEFEKAVESFQQSISIIDNTPSVWYALVNAYDALGDYDKAYSACLRTDELLKSSDTYFDHYGIDIHNKSLMFRLKPKLKEK